MRDIYKKYIGKYVIVRTYNEGINAGVLEDADVGICVISQARRLWKHCPKDTNTKWYEGVSVTGLGSESLLSIPVPTKIIVEDYSITVCTAEAEKSIREYQAG